MNIRDAVAKHQVHRAFKKFPNSCVCVMLFAVRAKLDRITQGRE